MVKMLKPDKSPCYTGKKELQQMMKRGVWLGNTVRKAGKKHKDLQNTEAW